MVRCPKCNRELEKLTGKHKIAVQISEGKKFNLSEERKKTRKDINYLFSKIKWDASFLDAKAITIMNEFWKDITNADKEFIERIEEDVLKNNYSMKKRLEILNKLAGDKLTV